MNDSIITTAAVTFVLGFSAAALAARVAVPPAHAPRRDDERPAMQWAQPNTPAPVHDAGEEADDVSEPARPGLVRPNQGACPDCACCTAELCERGRVNVDQCAGLTPTFLQETVFDCPCSSAGTPGTHAWRALRVRASQFARLPRPDIELALRALADGHQVDDADALWLRMSGLAMEVEAESRHMVTELGRLYLSARDGWRSTTCRVEGVDTQLGTASVLVTGWSPTEPVTVLLEQLVEATGLDATALPGVRLDAAANLTDARTADEVVLDLITVASVPGQWVTAVWGVQQ